MYLALSGRSISYTIQLIIALCGLALAGALTIYFPYGVEAERILLNDPLSKFIKVAAILSAAILAALNPIQAKNDSQNTTFLPSLLLSTVGLFVMASASDLVALFFGMELAYLPVYFRNILKSNDSAVPDKNKFYDSLSLISGAVFCALGFALLYGLSGSTNLIQMKINFSLLFLSYQRIGPAFIVGASLVIVGLVVKMGAAPFHLWWSGRSHESAQSSISIGLFIGIMTCVIVVLKALTNGLVAFSEEVMEPLNWPPLLSVFASLSMLWSAVILLRARSLGEFVTGFFMAQMGFLLVALRIATVAGIVASLFQCVTLLVTIILITGALNSINSGFEKSHFSSLRGVASKAPARGIALILCLASFAAVPYTGGFLARQKLIEATADVELWWLLSLVILISVLVAYRALRLIWTILSPSDENALAIDMEGNYRINITALVGSILLVAVGVFPEPTMALAVRVAESFMI